MDYSPTVRSIKRLLDIKSLVKEGQTVHEISKTLGLDHKVVKSYLSYLDELSICAISVEELAMRRTEIDLEYLEMIEVAKNMVYDNKDKEDGLPAAKAFYREWRDSVDRRQKLYGLDEPRGVPQNNSVTFVGSQTNTISISEEKQDRIAEAIIDGEIE